MKINLDGKLNSFDRASLEIMNEFDFNMESMSDEIISLRDKVSLLEDEILGLREKNDEIKS